MTDERIDTGYAALKTDSDDVPIEVSGVAIGEGDITSGDTGKRTLWPKGTLQNAPLRGSREALEGQPIATDDNHTAKGTKPQTPSEAVRGQISWAGYKPGVGVVYEGEVDDPDIARSVENDRLEVSPLVSRELEALEGKVAEKYRERGYDVDEADYVATEINRWRDLATVVSGAAPSNEITVGSNPMKAEALHEAITDAKDENVSESQGDDSSNEVSNAEALKEVAGVSFEGTAEGKLDESEIPSEGYEDHYLYPGDTKTESSYPVVDAEGNLRRGNVDAAWSLGARGDADDDTHDERLLELAQEFENPPEWATDEAMAQNVDEPAESGTDTQSDEGTNGGSAPSSVAANSEETMTEDLTDTEKAILEAAEGVDEPTEALNEYAATEGPTIVAQSEYESLQENVEEVRDVLTEALSEKTELKDSTIEALGFEALCDEFRDDEGSLQVEALRQVPESGEPESGGEAEALSEDADVEKAEALMADYQMMGNPPEGLEDDITEALGVSDFDDAKEVLD